MKRMLALLLCILICMTLIPAAVAAETAENEAGEIELISLDGESDEEEIVLVGEEALATNGKPAITTQPKSVTAYIGTTAKFTVKATGATGYQWQYRKSAANSWHDSSAAGSKTATLSVGATATRSGFQYRCKVTNSAGTTYSGAATLTVQSKPVITTQPTSRNAAVGTTVKFTVKADGATSYQWQYRKSAANSWHDSSATGSKTATMSIGATAARDGFQFRCKVKNDKGTTYSSAATLTILTQPAITTQPTSKSAAAGTTAKFTVKATGGALSYQWQYRKSSSSSWYDSSATGSKTATLSVGAKAARDGFQYRCKVTNALGTVYTKTVKLSVVNYRALLVGEVNFHYQDYAPMFRGGVDIMEETLENVKNPRGGSYAVTRKTDLSIAQLKSAISTAFADADENDVSLFYIATHGAIDFPYGEQAGQLLLIGNEYDEFMTFKELAKCLNSVKGTVIVFIDSCSSGSAVQVVNGVGEKETFDAEAFNASAISAFAALEEDAARPNTGELRSSKFYVMTSAAHQEEGWGYNYDWGYTFFPFCIRSGVLGEKAADANGNGTITLSELYGYVYQMMLDGGPYYDEGYGGYINVNVSSHAQVYPENSSYALFK